MFFKYNLFCMSIHVTLTVTVTVLVFFWFVDTVYGLLEMSTEINIQNLKKKCNTFKFCEGIKVLTCFLYHDLNIVGYTPCSIEAISSLKIVKVVTFNIKSLKLTTNEV